MIMSYQMINVYQLYIIQNYIGQSVKESAVTVSVVSMIMMVMSLVGSFISGPVSDLIGRRKVPVVVASVLFAIGIAMPWLIPSTLGMYLFAGIAGLGYAVYSAVDQALLVDVLPNKEEAGKDLGILNMGTTPWVRCVARSSCPPSWCPSLQLRLPDRHRPGHHRLLLHYGHQEGQVSNPSLNDCPGSVVFPFSIGSGVFRKEANNCKLMNPKDL